MNLLDRYIARIILYAILIVLAVILALDSFINFIRFSDDIGQGSFTLRHLFQYLFYMIPSRIYLVFPFAALIGTMMGLSYLASNSEIVAMRSSGISTMRLVASVVKLGLILSIILFFIGEYLAPMGQRIAHREKDMAIYNNVTLDIKNEVWIRDQQTYTNIRAVKANNVLTDINIYTFHPDGTLKHTIHAETATFNGKQWMLNQVKQTLFEPNRLEVETFPQYKWNIPFNLDLVEIITSSVSHLSLFELYHYIRYLQKNNIDSRHYELQFWQKITAPFTLVVMLILAFPFAIGNNRSGKVEEKVFIGVIVGLLFYMANTISSQLTLLFNFPALLSSVALSSLTLLFALIFLRKI